MTINDPEDSRCIHCDGRHVSDSCPTLPRRQDARWITETREHPATVTISKESLSQMLHRYSPECIHRGETVGHVMSLDDGGICIFLRPKAMTDEVLTPEVATDLDACMPAENLPKGVV